MLALPSVKDGTHLPCGVGRSATTCSRWERIIGERVPRGAGAQRVALLETWREPFIRAARARGLREGALWMNKTLHRLTHGHGRAARAVVEDARAAVATLTGTDARDVIFTAPRASLYIGPMCT